MAKRSRQRGSQAEESQVVTLDDPAVDAAVTCSSCSGVYESLPACMVCMKPVCGGCLVDKKCPGCRAAKPEESKVAVEAIEQLKHARAAALRAWESVAPPEPLQKAAPREARRIRESASGLVDDLDALLLKLGHRQPPAPWDE